MKFALVKITGSKIDDHTHEYQALIMELGASSKWTYLFKNEDEMVEGMNRILARQNKRANIKRLLTQIRREGYYFFDLDLTQQEAESLGWKRTPVDQNGDSYRQGKIHPLSKFAQCARE